MSPLVAIITSRDSEVRNRALDSICRGLSTRELLDECAALDRFWRTCENLYERVRAQFFLFSIYRFHLPFRAEIGACGHTPFAATKYLLQRRFEEAIECLLHSAGTAAMNTALASGLAAAYRGLGFKTLADRVRLSVRSVRGNQWMSRIGHPEDYPLAIHADLLAGPPYPILQETTPVRMDLTHSAWSDIFFLGMDFPEGARVLNVSIDLNIHGVGHPAPPVESYFRVIDEPILRLTSVDLNDTTDISTFAELFDFARDNLGLLKAAIIASGIVPPAMEGALQPLSTLLNRLAGPGKGIELVSRVRDIPKGSRLAVSTNLLASLISACMRATSQIKNLTGMLGEKDRRLVAARAILGEWLGGSGGGWQDSGGVWPGMKIIEGAEAREGDPEFGVSRGRLLPSHRVIGPDEISERTREALQESLVLVHGGMAQDVGPILEMVTEKYLLRSEKEWIARQEAIQILDRILVGLRQGNIREIGMATEQNFFGPIQSIVPWTSNRYTEILIEQARAEFGADFWGFWMLGGMSGGGMGFIFHPDKKREAQVRMGNIMLETKRQLEHAVPFAMDPVVYDFTINERGTFAEIFTGDKSLMPEAYYAFVVPKLLRMVPSEIPAYRRMELDCFASACRTLPELSGVVQGLFDRLLPSFTQETDRPGKSLPDLLNEYGFDRVAHEQIRFDLSNGRIGLAQNRLPPRTRIEDVETGDVFDGRDPNALKERFQAIGMAALAEGKVAILSLAGGAGSRWTKGAGVVKALNPFCKFQGRHRNFIEVHLAKSRRTGRLCGAPPPYIITTSYLTHAPIREQLTGVGAHRYQYEGQVLLSPGRSIGLRLVPMVRDLHFAWSEMPQQLLDEQKQKVRDSAHAALANWALQKGEATDYTDNIPMQCLHPTGHWYEVSNILKNGVLFDLLRIRPQLTYLMVHNIDTVGADVDASLLGYHIEQGAGLTFEVITRNIDDRGGGLARVEGRLRLIEGMALPSEELDCTLSYYNSNTSWIDIDQFLGSFALSRADLGNTEKVAAAIRTLASRMPTYITLKDVKKRWGKGQEDIFPVAQFEKLFVDMTAISELNSRFIVVSRQRGQQLKEPAQLDGWLRDGSAEYVESLCDWDGS
jgi:galactokinase/mevalonate kinase-like predicted kinase